ncbi:1-acyl-sn-glycerol-3-phosphate acyltransferase [Thermodesulfobacteriota bacterium]
MKESKRIYRTPAMHNDFGPILRWIFRRFFSRIKVEADDVERLRALSEKGPLIYALKNVSLLQYLYFNYLFDREGLPLARFVNGVHTTVWQPWRLALTILAKRLFGMEKSGDPDKAEKRFAELTREGESSLVFLRSSMGHLIRSKQREYRLIGEAVGVQREEEKEITLVPLIVIWGKRPDSGQRSIVDTLFGEEESPGLIRELVIFARRHRSAFVRIGDTVDLKTFVDANGNSRDGEIARKAAWSLLSEFKREKSVITGPAMKPRRLIIKTVLETARMKRVIEEVAQQEGRDREKVRETARKYLEEIASDYHIGYIAILAIVFDWIWRNIYDGLHIDMKGLARVKRAAKRAPLILLPNHRSHMDYLFLSYIFFRHDISPPQIAAGINLSFWPLGFLFRRAGAYFLRRSFKGNPLYAKVFTEYVKRLLREGYTQEFFIEGTRSRTGKFIAPKLGMLGMQVEAFSEGASDDVMLVPIAISYERILEQNAYSDELSGAPKVKESLWELVKTRKFLKNKLGRVYIQFAEPISLKDYLDARPDRFTSFDQAKNKPLIDDLARTIVYSINEVIMVTPSALLATALLSTGKRGTDHEGLVRRAALFERVLRRRETRLSPLLQTLGRAVDETIRLFISNRLITKYESSDGEVIYAMPEDGRLKLRFYSNNIIHFLLPSSIAACSVLVDGSEASDMDSLGGRVRFIHDLLSEEFIHPPNLDVAPALGEGIGVLKGLGFVEVTDDQFVRLIAGREEDVRTIGRLLDDLFESYYIVFRTIAGLRANVGRKDFIKQAMEMGEFLFQKEEIVRREALSRITIQNALQYCLRTRILSEPEGFSEPEGVSRLRGGAPIYCTREGADVIEGIMTKLKPMLPSSIA